MQNNLEQRLRIIGAQVSVFRGRIAEFKKEQEKESKEECEQYIARIDATVEEFISFYEKIDAACGEADVEGGINRDLAYSILGDFNQLDQHFTMLHDEASEKLKGK